MSRMNGYRQTGSQFPPAFQHTAHTNFQKSFQEDANFDQQRRKSVVNPKLGCVTNGSGVGTKMRRGDSYSFQLLMAPDDYQIQPRSSEIISPKIKPQKAVKTRKEHNILYRIAKSVFNALIAEFQNLMDIMQTSKGRDKIFALIQYSIDLYVKCMDCATDTDNPFRKSQLDAYTQLLVENGTTTLWNKFPKGLREIVRSGEEVSLRRLCVFHRNEAMFNREEYKVANNFVKAIRSGRKVFKLLKFVDELKEFVNLSKRLDTSAWKATLSDLFLKGKFDDSSPVYTDLLHLVNKINSFFYYLLDNMHWVASVGMLSSAVYNKTRWKWWKDMISLWKNYIQVFRSVLLYRQMKRKLQDCEKELSDIDHQVVGTTCLKATEIVRKWINHRSKMYDQMFVLVRNSLRILMLNYKLKIPVWRTILHPIFVICLGIFQNITALFKIWLKKKYHKLNGQMIRIQEYVSLLPRMEEYEGRTKTLSKRPSAATSSRISMDQGEERSSDMQQARQGTLKMPRDSLYSGNKAAYRMTRFLNLNRSISNSSVNQLIGQSPRTTQNHGINRNTSDSESFSSAVCLSKATDLEREAPIEQHQPVSKFFEDDYLYDAKVLFKGMSKGGYKLQSLRQNDIAHMNFCHLLCEDKSQKNQSEIASDSELEVQEIRPRYPVQNLCIDSPSESAGSD